MKFFQNNRAMEVVIDMWQMIPRRRCSALWGILVLVLTANQPLAASDDATKSFANPEEAVACLASAVKSNDQVALRSLFGADLTQIENPDRVQATNEFLAFASALDERFRLIRESPTKAVLEVGANSWPFPIPIVQRDGRWFFDTAAGREEILNRRIGRNELSVLQVMRAYVNAQRDYASRDRDGDEVLEYAGRIYSSPGKTDGLFWPPDLNGEISPLGPHMARAQEEGYFKAKHPEELGPQPFHGYLYKLLTRQGKHAPGGKYDYMINGNMIGGFALVAWPAEYGDSGVMTFIVNQQGRVYQKDLGKGTSKIAPKMSEYDPNKTWHASPD